MKQILRYKSKLEHTHRIFISIMYIYTFHYLSSKFQMKC